MRSFTQFACFDWSGQAVARPKGIALAIAQSDDAPRLISFPDGWSRPSALDWITHQATTQANILIGLDMSAGFPFCDEGAYFPGWWQSPATAPALWKLVDQICADDPHLSATSFVHHPQVLRHLRLTGHLGEAFPPGRGRLRVTEIASRDQGHANPYSCLNMIGAAQVGKSSLTAMRVFNRLRGIVPIWPFDPIPETGPLIVEIYTSIAAVSAKRQRGRSKMRDHDTLALALANLGSASPPALARYDDHATDALVTAAWLRKVAHEPEYWTPAQLTDEIAQTEGWTFGVV